MYLHPYTDLNPKWWNVLFFSKYEPWNKPRGRNNATISMVKNPGFDCSSASATSLKYVFIVLSFLQTLCSSVLLESVSVLVLYVAGGTWRNVSFHYVLYYLHVAEMIIKAHLPWPDFIYIRLQIETCACMVITFSLLLFLSTIFPSKHSWSYCSEALFKPPWPWPWPGSY